MAQSITERDIKEVKDELLQDFLEQSYKLLSDRKASGDTLRSLALVARDQVDAVLASEMSFVGYARIMDMKYRERRRDSRDGVARLKEWVKQKGVENFKPGYLKRYGKLPASDTRLINNIAWGIAKSPGKKRRRRGRLKWYNRRKSGMLVQLFDKVAVAVLEAAPLEINPNNN